MGGVRIGVGETDVSRLSSRFLVWWVAVLLMQIKEFRNRSRCVWWKENIISVMDVLGLKYGDIEVRVLC